MENMYLPGSKSAAALRSRSSSVLPSGTGNVPAEDNNVLPPQSTPSTNLERTEPSSIFQQGGRRVALERAAKQSEIHPGKPAASARFRRAGARTVHQQVRMMNDTARSSFYREA